MTRSRTELSAYAGIFASLAAALLLLVPWHGLAMPGALLLACVPAGAAVMCWVDSGENIAQTGLILVLSLAVLAIAAAIMIWANAWEPHALLAVLAGASIVSCALSLHRRSAKR
jgi:hypothetical protein